MRSEIFSGTMIVEMLNEISGEVRIYLCVKQNGPDKNALVHVGCATHNYTQLLQSRAKIDDPLNCIL